jgi:hypothetical protein
MGFLQEFEYLFDMNHPTGLLRVGPDLIEDQRDIPEVPGHPLHRLRIAVRAVEPTDS